MRRSMRSPWPSVRTAGVGSGEEIRLVDFTADAVASVLDPGQERADSLAEDLADVDVAELAVEAVESPLGLGAESGPFGDDAERFEAAGDAEPDGAGEVGVEHEVADDPLRVDPVVVLAE